METLGEFLRRWRRRSGLSQEEAGDACGVSRQSINAWESGRSTPSTMRLAQLLEAYEVPTNLWGDALKACASWPKK